MLAALFLAPALALAADDLAGQASVIDGDTLEIHDTVFGFGESTRRSSVLNLGMGSPARLTLTTNLLISRA